MHGSTCHAAVAFKSAAVKLSATPRAERMLSPVQQPIDAWQLVPCCSCIQEPVQAFLDRPSRLAALGWRHGHASVAALCWAIELVGSLNNTSGEEDLDIVLDGCE